MPVVKIDTRRIKDWETFHDVFAEAFGFPDFYGRNMDAWIDCLSYLDDPETGMTVIQATDGIVAVQLEYVDDFIHRCPAQYAALIDCSAFVNWRRIEIGQPAVLALSFYKQS